MIIAGPCSYVDYSQEQDILETAIQLNGVADYFRCKIWLGGTTPEKYHIGMGYCGLGLLGQIDSSFMPVMTEVQITNHIKACKHYVSSIWVGARNSQNYGLFSYLSKWHGQLFIKRSPGMTINEVVGVHDIFKDIYNKNVSIIERGINTFDRQEDSRWSPDLKGVMRIKHERPDVFEKMIIDCSHSVGQKKYIEDAYRAFKSIGCNHFMFECTASGESKTDQNHVISVDRLKEIIKDDKK